MRRRRAVRAMLLLLAALYGLFPVYYVTVQSLKTPEEDVFGNPFYVARPTFSRATRRRCAAT